MRGLLAAAVLALLARSAPAEYLLFYENGKAGLRDESGKVILPPSFDELGWTDGSFSVINEVTGYRQKSNWGLVNVKKEFVTKPVYESLTSAAADHVVASQWINPYTKKFGCIDLSGNVTVPFHYDGITVIGLHAIVFLKNGLKYEYGVIDLQNRSIIPMRYRDIRPIGSLRFAIQNFEGKTALFTDQGTQVTGFVIDSIAPFRKSKAIIHQKLRQGLIDREGGVLLEPTYREILVEDDRVMVRGGDEWKILDSRNNEVAKVEADNLLPAGSYYLVNTAGKFGLLDENLDNRIPIKYDFLGQIENNFVVARSGGKYGVLRVNGETLLSFDHDSLLLEGHFVRSMASRGGRPEWSVYDTFSVKKTARIYDRIEPFNGKFFPVSHLGFWGVVDRYGNERLRCVYDSLVNFTDDLLAVKFKGLYGIIDANERWKVLPQPRPLALVNDNLYLEYLNTITFLKSLAGEIIYFTENEITASGNHLAETLPDGEVKMVSLKGISTLVSAPPALDDTEKVFAESDGMRGIRRNGRFGFIDDRGRLRVANRYEDIGWFREGLAPAMILGKWGYVNKADQIVINPNYDEAEEFVNGLAVVRRNGRSGVIDRTGKIILPLRYDSILRTQSKLILLTGNKTGLADDAGRVLIEPTFELLRPVSNDLVIVSNSGRWGVLTHDGMTVIPQIYDHIGYNVATDHFLVVRKAEWKKVPLAN